MDFVIIANAWGASLDNPTSKHQIAMELAKAGHRVLWIEGAGMRRPRLVAGNDRLRILRKVGASLRGVKRVQGVEGAIHVVAPLLVPLPDKEWARVANGKLVRIVAGFWVRRLGFRQPVLINYVPILAEAMLKWPHKVVYHCVDRWDRFNMYASHVMTEMDRRCCHYADVIIASSADLYEHCQRQHNHVYLVDHGVNHEHFAKALEPDIPRPPDLPEGPIIGFFGLLSEWVDQALLVRLVREVPNARLVLIGRADVSVASLAGQPRIVRLGPKPFAELPRYVAAFDVGIIPFTVNDLTRAVNPIKLREMLAAGCPVVATALPEVARLGDAHADEAVRRAVIVADTDDAFVEHVRRLVEQPMNHEERQQLSEAMRSETWEAKTREIVEIVESVTR